MIDLTRYGFEIIGRSPSLEIDPELKRYHEQGFKAKVLKDGSVEVKLALGTALVEEFLGETMMQVNLKQGPSANEKLVCFLNATGDVAAHFVACLLRSLEDWPLIVTVGNETFHRESFWIYKKRVDNKFISFGFDEDSFEFYATCNREVKSVAFDHPAVFSIEKLKKLASDVLEECKEN